MTQPSVAMDLMRRAVTIAERQWPEMADSAMEIPLGYFNDPEWRDASGNCSKPLLSHWSRRTRSHGHTTTSCATRSVDRSYSPETRTEGLTPS